MFLPVFEALWRAGVRYVTVGGVATVLHGYARLTADIDLVIHLEPENWRRAIAALVDLGFRPRAPVDPFDFADAAKREDWVRSKGLTVFSLFGTSSIPMEVDVFMEEPMDFERLWTNRVERRIGDTTVQLVDKKSLIEMKRSVGQPQDLEDVAALEGLPDE